MLTSSVFENNRSQAVRIPAQVKFPAEVKKVTVRVVGNERILSPIEQSWDSFFLSNEQIDDDFITERASQEQAEREPF